MRQLNNFKVKNITNKEGRVRRFTVFSLVLEATLGKHSCIISSHHSSNTWNLRMIDLRSRSDCPPLQELLLLRRGGFGVRQCHLTVSEAPFILLLSNETTLDSSPQGRNISTGQPRDTALHVIKCRSLIPYLV